MIPTGGAGLDVKFMFEDMVWVFVLYCECGVERCGVVLCVAVWCCVLLCVAVCCCVLLCVLLCDVVRVLCCVSGEAR